MQKPILTFLLLIEWTICCNGAGFSYNFAEGKPEALTFKGALQYQNHVLRFPEQGSHAIVPNSENMNFLEKGGTLRMVCRFSDRKDNPKRFQFMCNKDDSFLLGITNNRYNFSLCQGGKWSLALMGGNPPDGDEWVHLTAIAEFINEVEQGRLGFQMSLFVNGLKIMSKFAPCGSPKPSDKRPLTLGNASLQFGFLGEIAECSFEDRILTEAEILKDVKRCPLVSFKRPGIFELNQAAADKFAEMEMSCADPISRWRISMLKLAAETGKTGDIEAALAASEALQSGKYMGKNPDLVGLEFGGNADLEWAIASGSGCRFSPLVGIWDKKSQRNLFGERAIQWRLDYVTAKRIPLNMVDWREEVSFRVKNLKRDSQGGKWRFTWHKNNFTVVSEMKIAGPRIEFDCCVDNSDDNCLLTEVTFPNFEFKRLPGKGDVLVYTNMSGTLIDDPTQKACMEYWFPRAQQSMQFIGYYDELRNGLYCGQEDPFACSKYSSIRGSGGQLCCFWRTPVSCPVDAQGGNNFQMSGKAVVEAYTGSWYESGTIYRRFLEHQAQWWIPDLPRTSSPEWFVNNSIWILAGVYPSSNEAVLRYLREYFEMPFGVHLVGWSNNKRIWPHFNEANEEAKKRLARLQEVGLKVFPYADPRIWSMTDSPDGKGDWMFSSHGKPNAALQANGDFHIERYGDITCAVMCPATKGWQDWVLGYSRNIANIGFDGVYHDQLSAGEPVLCHATTHGHDKNSEFAWLRDGYWPMYAKIGQELSQDYPHFGHTSEDAEEPFLRALDGFMCWRWTDPNHVPLFQAIYSGRIQFVGRLFNHQFPGSWESSFAKLGEQLVYAEQLGWITLEDLEWASPLRLYMKKLAHLRKSLLEYFNCGQMQAPLNFAVEPECLTTVWGSSRFEGQIVKTHKILHSGWQLKDGRKMWIFLNTVDEKQEIKPILQANLQSKEMTICRCDGSLAKLSGGVASITVSLPAYGWEIWLDGASEKEIARISQVQKTIASFVDMGMTLRKKKIHNFEPWSGNTGSFYPVNRATELHDCYLRPFKSGGGFVDGVLQADDKGRLLYANLGELATPIREIEIIYAAAEQLSGGVIIVNKIAKNETHEIARLPVASTGSWYNFTREKIALSKEVTAEDSLEFLFNGKTGIFRGWQITSENRQQGKD